MRVSYLRVVLLSEPAHEDAIRMQFTQRQINELGKWFGADAVDNWLWKCALNSLNPSSGLSLAGSIAHVQSSFWYHPVQALILQSEGDLLYAPEAGLAYPFTREIPMLRAEHSIADSKIRSSFFRKTNML